MTKKAIRKAGINATVTAVDNENTQPTEAFVASIGESDDPKSDPVFSEEADFPGAPDASASIQRLEASAAKGNAKAQFDFGLRHLHGKGVEKDVQAAGYWFAMAAEQQYLPAFRELGTLSRLGWGTDPDLAEACSLQLIAAESGDKLACRNLADYQSDLVALALVGDRQMASFLVQIYDHGLGVQKSPALTWAWLRWAHDGCGPVAADIPDAQSINDDIDEAFRFFRMVLDKSVMEEGEALLVQWLKDARPDGVWTFD